MVVSIQHGWPFLLIPNSLSELIYLTYLFQLPLHVQIGNHSHKVPSGSRGILVIPCSVRGRGSNWEWFQEDAPLESSLFLPVTEGARDGLGTEGTPSRLGQLWQRQVLGMGLTEGWSSGKNIIIRKTKRHFLSCISETMCQPGSLALLFGGLDLPRNIHVILMFLSGAQIL